ncbi:putative bifunctional diguanylate cyclase/phosphodiesterase [Deinococcus aquiradiocola]|uniref:Diguanylate cyclase n=1 Tax=Deinococcus aquiradiocola TaxID=393059 RepID=A0A917PGN2_9DEIO|nr:EAL domain-containing protein [Deinococcus aquiradiocola]GGJ77135.1 hypothetical protein GCM10008939_21560 [Deinococcus aquiradiocola]
MHRSSTSSVAPPAQDGDAAATYFRVLDRMVDLSGAVRGLIAAPVRVGGPFEILSSRNVSPGLLQRLRHFTLLPGSELTAAVRTARPFLLSDAMRGELPPGSRLDRTLTAQLGPVLMLPVDVQGELLALVALNVPHGLPDAAVLADLLNASRDLLPDLRGAQLQRSELQADTMLEVLEEGVLLFDPAGRMLRANAAARRIAGVERDGDLPGAFDDRWGLMDVHGLPLPMHAYPVASAIRAGQSVRDIEAMYVRPDGRRIVVSINATPLVVDQTGRGAVVSFVDITARHHLQAQLRAQAMQDPLTGLPNRRALQVLLEQLCLQDAQGQTMLLLVCIERFKRISDRHGQQVAETLVQKVARRIQAHLAPNGTVAHLSGHEFVVLHPVRDEGHAEQLTCALLGALALPYEAAGVDVTPTFRAGFVLHPQDGFTPGELLRHADLALQQGRSGLDGHWQRFTPDLAASRHRRDRIETHLQTAIAQERLHVHYQPVTCLQNGRITSLEALLRWTDEELGVVSPAEFIPVAESTGLIRTLGQYVLREALRQVREWNSAATHPVSVNVNVSASQLHHATFPEEVRDALERAGVAAHHLTIEVTEAVAVNDLPNVTRHLQHLKRLGVRVALDDFGTGHSSLAVLNRLPIDILKLDRQFVQGVHLDHTKQVLLRNAVRLGLELGFQVVAEGVEVQPELEFLLGCDCTHVQGFLLARPAPPTAIALP